MQIQIGWLLQKPADLDLHCLQRQGISRLSSTRVKSYLFFIFKITEALSYLHGTEQMIHRNVCPQSVLVTRRGNWKLAGLGFAERVKDGKVSILVFVRAQLFKASLA